MVGASGSLLGWPQRPLRQVLGPFSKNTVACPRFACTIISMYHLTTESSKQAVRIIESWASLQWKVLGHHYTRLDMIQEGYLVLDRVVSRYGTTRSENHLLSTLSASLSNRSNDLSRRPDRDACISDFAEDSDSLPSAEAAYSQDFGSDSPDWLNKLLEFVQGATPRQLAAIRADGGDDYLADKCDLPRGLPVRRMVAEALGAA